MKFSILTLSLMALTLAACVTEPKDPEGEKPYVEMISSTQAQKNMATSQVDSRFGIAVKCQTKYDKNAKNIPCNGPTLVKLLDERGKTVSEHPLRGPYIVVPASPNVSYMVEVRTKGCEEPRRTNGMIAGMALTAQFENCGGK